MRRAVIALAFLVGCGGSESPDAGKKKKEPVQAEKTPPPPSTWSTYHGGFDLTGVADSTVPDAPVRLWRFKAGDEVETTPVSAEGRLFFATVEGTLFALDLDGKELWKKTLEKDAFSSPPMITEGLVVLGTENGHLRAYEAASGTEKWSYLVDDQLQGTANRVELAEGKKGVIALASSDGVIHCVDLETGKGLWKTEPFERCDGSASVADGRIILGSCASALHVFTVSQSKKTADIELGGDSQVAGGVAMVGPLAYAGSRSGKVVAIDVQKRTKLWEHHDSKRETFSTPAVSGDSVVYGSDNGKVYALDRETGKQRWVFDTEDSPLSPVIAGDRVAVSSGGTLYLLDLKTGKKVWSAEVSDEITSPAVVGGRLIVGSRDGTVSAYGAK